MLTPLAAKIRKQPIFERLGVDMFHFSTDLFQTKNINAHILFYKHLTFSDAESQICLQKRTSDS